MKELSDKATAMIDGLVVAVDTRSNQWADKIRGNLVAYIADLERRAPKDASTQPVGEADDEPYWNTIANELLCEFCACYGEAWPANTCHTERRRLVPWLKSRFGKAALATQATATQETK